MAKRLFLLLFLSLIGVINTPSFLTADDSFIAKQPEFHAVKTVEIEETAEINEVAQVNEDQNNISNNTPVMSLNTPVVAEQVVAPAPVVPINHIDIAGRTLEIVTVNDTAVDSGNHVNRYGSRFLYGHNTGAVFGGLVNLGVGSSFTVSIDGTSMTYQVKKVVIFEKNTANGRLQLNGEGNYMRKVANATHEGVQYGLSLMTCYGTSYGNGDASHRLVLFADAV